jgi:hypothetical protein
MRDRSRCLPIARELRRRCSSKKSLLRYKRPEAPRRGTKTHFSTACGCRQRWPTPPGGVCCRLQLVAEQGLSGPRRLHHGPEGARCSTLCTQASATARARPAVLSECQAISLPSSNSSLWCDTRPAPATTRGVGARVIHDSAGPRRLPRSARQGGCSSPRSRAVRCALVTPLRPGESETHPKCAHEVPDCGTMSLCGLWRGFHLGPHACVSLLVCDIPI